MALTSPTKRISGEGSVGPEETCSAFIPPPAGQFAIKIISLLAAFTLAAALLYYSLRGIEWSQAGTLIAGANLGLLALVAVIMTFSIFLRGVRWRVSAHGGRSCRSARRVLGYLGWLFREQFPAGTCWSWCGRL